MPLSRRAFIHTTAAAAAAWPLAVRGWQAAPGTETGIFRHGVASGDPLTDRVMLWTRVTPPAGHSDSRPLDVRWQIASDEKMSNIVGRGTAQAAAERDFTVKVDAGNLEPGATYYYSFDSGGERSPVGRTKTLPVRGAQRLRLGQVSCSNYPTGYFNVYRCLANRPDLDAVVHLGDYIYEFASSRYSDPSLSRAVQPASEVVTLADYRTRYAYYRHDPDLQAVHRQHPFIVVWTITSWPTMRGQVAQAITTRARATGRFVSARRIARISSGCRYVSRLRTRFGCIGASRSAGWRI